jgi:hypothetical protein
MMRLRRDEMTVFYAVRSNGPVKAETSGTPVVANIPHVPALSALSAGRGAPPSLELKT